MTVYRGLWAAGLGLLLWGLMGLRHDCEAATLTVQVPTTQLYAVVDWLCAGGGKWPFWSPPASCQEGREAVMQAAFGSVVSWVAARSGFALDATLAVTDDTPLP